MRCDFLFSSFRLMRSKLLNDATKLMVLPKDPTEQFKPKVKSLIEILHMKIEPSKSIYSQKGNFTPAYLYEIPKVHKSIQDPKLKPIISQVSIPYIQSVQTFKANYHSTHARKYFLAPTYVFINLIIASYSPRVIMVSLDDERLFTSVPVADPIHRSTYSLMNNVNDNNELASPNIPTNLLKDILI